MPIVPYRADLGFTQQSVTNKATPDYTAAESIEKFGEGVAKTARAVEQYEAQLEKTKREMYKTTTVADARSTSQKKLDEALMEASPDGQDLFNVYEKKMASAKKEYFAQEKDPQLRAEMESYWDAVDSQNYDAVREKRYQMGKEWAGNQTLEIKNRLVSRARMNPIEARADYERFAQDVDKYGMTPMATAAAKLNAKKEAGFAAVNGYIDGKDFAGAIKAMRTDWGDTFDAKEQDEIIKRVEKAELESLKNDLQEDDNVLKQARDQQQLVQDSNFRSKFKTAQEIKSMGDATKTNRFLKDVDDDIASGILSPLRGSLIKKAVEKVPVQEDEEVVGELYERIVLRDDVETLNEDIARYAADNRLDPERALEMLTEVDRLKMSSGGQRALKENDPLVKNAAAFIKSSFHDQFVGWLDPSAKQNYAKAVNEFYKKLSEPKYAGDPFGLSQDILFKYGKSSKRSSADKLFPAKNTKEQGDLASQLYKTKKISKEKYKELLLSIKARTAEEDMVRERKDGKKK